MKFALFTTAALASFASMDLVQGQASPCMDPTGICEVEMSMNCADFFNATYIWSGYDSCCSFKEVDGMCTLMTSTSCQWDSKSKYVCDEEPCAMVGPRMISNVNSTESCPESEFEIPESSDVGTDGPPMPTPMMPATTGDNVTDTSSGAAASLFMSTLVVGVSAVALFQSIL